MPTFRSAAVTTAGLLAVVALPIAVWNAPGLVPSTSGETPTPVDSVAVDSPVSAADAPYFLITSTAVWDTQSRAAGGTRSTVEDDSGVVATVSLSPGGDLHATTTDPNRPEWISVGSTTFARFGDQELNANRDSLAEIGKPDAQWTDVAIGSDTWRALLSSADMGSLIGQISAAGSNFRVSNEPDSVTVTATVPTDAVPYLAARKLLTQSVEASVTVGRDRVPRTIRFSTDAQALLTVSLTGFEAATVTVPVQGLVVTIEDLIRLTAPVTAPVPAAPSPTSTLSAEG